MRVDDECKPILPDELTRLMTDRAAFVWETGMYVKAAKPDYDKQKLEQFVADVRNSDRVSNFVKAKNTDELLEHYLFAIGNQLTNLGILWVGKREHRARLLYAPSIQFLKYDNQEQKVFKQVWDDYSLNPKELIQAVWDAIPDWREGIEVEDGLYRRTILNYDETVIRELLANALVHRPYTIRGDIFINLYIDRLEIHNPGLFPLGVTPENILHQSVQRNPHLAKVFYDLKLMEKEGSGYDRMYETLLSQGKPIPVPTEGNDRVAIKVAKRIANKQVIQFMETVHKEFQLNQKELISLGLIAQHTALTSTEFANTLGLNFDEKIQDWLGNLIKLKLIKTKGRTKGMTYFIEPSVLKKHDFKGKTSLRNIEPHRLKHLIWEDLHVYKESSIGNIHERIGLEIPRRAIRYQIDLMLKTGEIQRAGDRKTRRYFIDN